MLDGVGDQKEKNMLMKKLIENNFEEKMTMNMTKEDEYKTAKEGFRPRKKVKTVRLSTEDDFY